MSGTKEHNYFGDLLESFNNEMKNKDKLIESKDENKIASNIASKENSKVVNGKNVLDGLVSNKNKTAKKNYKEFYKGIYFDEDIHRVLTNYVQLKNGRRNIQSQIVNDCLREAFQIRGLL